MRTALQIAAPLVLAAFMAAALPFRLVSSRPSAGRAPEPAAAFVAMSPAEYETLVRRMRTAWQVESRRRHAGATSPDAGLSVLEMPDPPPATTALFGAFRAARAERNAQTRTPGRIAIVPPSMAAADGTPPPAQSGPAFRPRAFGRDSMLAVPGSLRCAPGNDIGRQMR